MTEIYVDADACPVKAEVYRVAKRYGLKVYIVANAHMQVPAGAQVELVVVRGALDAADDWIAERTTADDIVVTTDVPLADRCVKRGASVLTPTGRRFTEDTVQDALATRDLLHQLRETGAMTGGGPAPFETKDRSRFLQRLDEAIQELKRKGR